MIKAVLFDFDGVLVDTGDLHTEMTVKAVKEFGMPPDSQFGGSNWDNLYEVLRGSTEPTRTKLLNTKIWTYTQVDHIYAIKKRLTNEHVKGRWEWSKRHWQMMQWLRDRRIKTGVVSNTGTEFMKIILTDLGIWNLFDCIVGNDTRSALNDRPLAGKPSPAPYVDAMLRLAVNAWECLALEDSHTGAVAANAAGVAGTLFITHPETLSFRTFQPFITRG